MDNAQYGLSKKKKIMPRIHKDMENITNFEPIKWVWEFMAYLAGYDGILLTSNSLAHFT